MSLLRGLISKFIVISEVLLIGFMDAGALLITLVNPSGFTTIEGELMLLGLIIGNIPLIAKKIRKKVIIEAWITRKLDKLLFATE